MSASRKTSRRATGIPAWRAARTATDRVVVMLSRRNSPLLLRREANVVIDSGSAVKAEPMWLLAPVAQGFSSIILPIRVSISSPLIPLRSRKLSVRSETAPSGSIGTLISTPKPRSGADCASRREEGPKGMTASVIFSGNLSHSASLVGSYPQSFTTMARRGGVPSPRIAPPGGPGCPGAGAFCAPPPGAAGTAEGSPCAGESAPVLFSPPGMRIVAPMVKNPARNAPRISGAHRHRFPAFLSPLSDFRRFILPWNRAASGRLRLVDEAGLEDLPPFQQLHGPFELDVFLLVLLFLQARSGGILSGLLFPRRLFLHPDLFGGRGFPIGSLLGLLLPLASQVPIDVLFPHRTGMRPRDGLPAVAHDDVRLDPLRPDGPPGGGIVPGRGEPEGRSVLQRDDRLNRPLAERRRPQQDRAPVVLERARDDLRRGGRTGVHQDDDRESAVRFFPVGR